MALNPQHFHGLKQPYVAARRTLIRLGYVRDASPVSTTTGLRAILSRYAKRWRHAQSSDNQNGEVGQ